MTRIHSAVHWRAALTLMLATATRAETLDPTNSAEAHITEDVLELREAVDLALHRQPLLEDFAAQAEAARHAAVSAAQLPDPQLFAGVRDLPVDTDDAFSLSNDSDTQLLVGIQQEFPRRAKRRFRGEARARQADRLEAEQRLAEERIRREVAVAWLEMWRDVRALSLADELRREADLQMRDVELMLRAGSANQAELVAARLLGERLEDEVSRSAQSVARSRNALRRWVGPAATLPPAQALPALILPEAPEVIRHLDKHPELRVLEARIQEEDAAIALARAAYAPDWRLELGYGHRPEFSEMVMLQVGVDLPLFTRDRQDRDVASAMALRDAARAAREDAIRRLEAEARLVADDLERLTTRLARYDDTILPQAALAIETAAADWRAGRGRLADVLEARRARLAFELERLELLHDATRRRIELAYFASGSSTAERTPGGAS